MSVRVLGVSYAADPTSGSLQWAGWRLIVPKLESPVPARRSLRQTASGSSPQDAGLAKMGLYGLPNRRVKTHWPRQSS